MSMTGTGSGAALTPEEQREDVIKEPPDDSELKAAGVVLIVVVARMVKHGEDAWVYALAAPMSPEFDVPAEEQIELSEHKFAYVGRTAPTPLKFQPGARVPVQVDKAALHLLDDGTCMLNLNGAVVLNPKGYPKGADTFAEIVAKTRHGKVLVEKSA